MKLHYGYFDGIRGLAVIIVWLSHSSGRDMALAPWLNFHGIGHVGVMLFFVLSGFLLSFSVMSENYNYKSYITRRFFRIAPLFYFVVLLTFLFQVLTNSLQNDYLYLDDNIQSLIKHLLFIKGDGIFWTIPVEFTFYFILFCHLSC